MSRYDEEFVPMTFKIPPSLKRKLRILAAVRGIGMSAIVRDLIEEGVENAKKEIESAVEITA